MSDIAKELRDCAARIDADGTASQIVSADELRALADLVSDTLDADHKRIAGLEANLSAARSALLMNPMAERIADLPDFMVALSEWGCYDPHDQADEITKFLNSTVGLREYLEDQTQAGGRDGN